MNRFSTDEVHLKKDKITLNTPYIRLVKFQLVRQIPDVYVSACVLAVKDRAGLYKGD